MQVDSYYKTRCYNYECQGFVQVNQNKSYTLGNVISPSNSIGSTEKYALGVKIKQVKLFFVKIMYTHSILY